MVWWNTVYGYENVYKECEKMEMLKIPSHITEFNYNCVKANKNTSRQKSMHRKKCFKKVIVIASG